MFGPYRYFRELTVRLFGTKYVVILSLQKNNNYHVRILFCYALILVFCRRNIIILRNIILVESRSSRNTILKCIDNF